MKYTSVKVDISPKIEKKNPNGEDLSTEARPIQALKLKRCVS